MALTDGITTYRDRLVFVTALYLCFTPVIHGQGCSLIDSCSCNMDDGRGVVDLSSMGDNNGFAKFYALPSPDLFYYSVNLCYPFNEGDCFNAAVCQTSADFTQTYQIGDAYSTAFNIDPYGDLHVVYTAPTGDGNIRTADITLRCDQNQFDPTIDVFGEQGFQSMIYLFTITSRCACPGVCAEGPGPGPDPGPDPGPGPGPNPGPHHGPGSSEADGGISTGSILLIVVIVLSFVYVVGGMTFLRLRKQATGTEMIPNRNFWTLLPGLIKDGFVFTYQKIRSRCDKNYQAI